MRGEPEDDEHADLAAFCATAKSDRVIDSESKEVR